MRYVVHDISEVESAPRPRRRPKHGARFLRLFPPKFASDQRAATAVEFALISPILILMIAGIVDYGGYFWTSHAVQQMANDAARAAIAGSTATQRLELAEAMFEAQKDNYSFMLEGVAELNLNEHSQTYVVTLTYTPTSGDFDLIGTLPGMPDQIVRTAAVAYGGY